MTQPLARRTCPLIPSVFALALCWSHAFAADQAHCKLETLAAVDLSVREAGPLVPATVDDHPVWLVLRTDVGITRFNPLAVVQLGLHTEVLPPDFELLTDGKRVKASTSFHSFNIATLKLKKDYAWVDPTPEAARAQVIEGRTLLGSLGMDVLWHYDFELDPARSKLTLYAPNHCGAHAVYWPGTVKRLDVEIAPMGDPVGEAARRFELLQGVDRPGPHRGHRFQ